MKNKHEYQGNQYTFRNALAIHLKADPVRNLANVFLEVDFCISCFYQVR